MSPLHTEHTDETMGNRNDLAPTGADPTELEVTPLQQNAAYRALRQRDVWLRKTWGPISRRA